MIFLFELILFYRLELYMISIFLLASNYKHPEVTEYQLFLISDTLYPSICLHVFVISIITAELLLVTFIYLHAEQISNILDTGFCSQPLKFLIEAVCNTNLLSGRWVHWLMTHSFTVNEQFLNIITLIQEKKIRLASEVNHIIVLNFQIKS